MSDTIKKLVSWETWLSYPNIIKPFVIHTDASKLQLGGVISQDDNPITTERKLLSIVEILKEFRNILLGQLIKVYIDHTKHLKKSHAMETSSWRI